MENPVNTENVVRLFKAVKYTIVQDECSLAEACKRNGFLKADMEKFLARFKKTAKIHLVWKKIIQISDDVQCSKYARMRLAGNMRGSTNVRINNVEELYNTFVAPGLSLTGEELKAYKEKRPYVDFDAIAEFWNKYNSGELYKDSIIKRLNELKKEFKNGVFSNIKLQVKQHDFLRNNEEISILISEVETLWTKKKTQNEKARKEKSEARLKEEEIGYVTRHVERYNNMSKQQIQSDRLDDLVLKVASLSDEEVIENYPGVDIGDLRVAAKKISDARDPEMIRLNQEKAQQREEANIRIENVIRGAFIENGILSKEDLDRFISEYSYIIPLTKQRLEKAWEKFFGYLNSSDQELQDKKCRLELDLKYLNTYMYLIGKFIMVDYYKLLKKTPEQLDEIEKEVERNQGLIGYNNRRFRVSNPLGDIIIDDDEKDLYRQKSGEARYYRTQEDIYKIANELKND